MVSLNMESLQELSRHALENGGSNSVVVWASTRMLVLADALNVYVNDAIRVPFYCAFPSKGRADGAVQPRVAMSKQAVCLIDRADGLLHEIEPLAA